GCRVGASFVLDFGSFHRWKGTKRIDRLQFPNLKNMLCSISFIKDTIDSGSHLNLIALDGNSRVGLKI
ncbi:hypothetical protein ACFLU5_00790, partial [Bacteroidota bacterium]